LDGVEEGALPGEGRSEAHAVCAAFAFLLVAVGRVPGVSVTPCSLRQFV
jgi:hypothetical protein